MPTIGKLNLKLTADTTSYLRKMRTAKGVTGKFNAGILALGSSLKSFGAVAAAAAAGGLLLLGKRQLVAIDQAVKLSDVLGTTIGKLEGLRLAATLSGSPIESLDKGLARLAKNIGLISLGIGTTNAKKLLQKFKLDIQDLNRQSPAESFIDIAEGIKTLGTESEKAAAAQELLGRGGLDLLLTLKLGKKGLMDIRNEVTLFGLDLTRTQSKGVEDFNDSIARLGASFRGLGNSIAIAIAPFAKFIDRLTNGIAILNIFTKKLFNQDAGKEVAAFGKKHNLTNADRGRSSIDAASDAFNPITLSSVGSFVVRNSIPGRIAQTNDLLKRILEKEPTGVVLE